MRVEYTRSLLRYDERMTPLEALVCAFALFVIERLGAKWIDRNRVSIKGGNYSVEAPNAQVARDMLNRMQEMRDSGGLR